MKAFKTPIHGIGTFLLPLSIYAVVLMDFWTDVADKSQEVIQDFIPVPPEVGLKDGHLLLCVLLHIRAAATVGSQSPASWAWNSSSRLTSHVGGSSDSEAAGGSRQPNSARSPLSFVS